MEQYISKSALVAEIEKLQSEIAEEKKLHEDNSMWYNGINHGFNLTKDILNTLEVKDGDSIVNPYDACIQYASIEAGIKAHAEDYSWNIESELFQQLTSEQQKQWRKEIEQACISGGYSGLNLAKDTRYKETFEVKEVDLEKEIQNHIKECLDVKFPTTDVELIKKDVAYTAKKFFELGLKSQKG